MTGMEFGVLGLQLVETLLRAICSAHSFQKKQHTHTHAQPVIFQKNSTANSISYFSLPERGSVVSGSCRGEGMSFRRAQNNNYNLRIIIVIIIINIYVHLSPVSAKALTLKIQAR